MSFAALAEKMVVFVVLMLIGYVSARTKFIGREFIKDASKIVVNIFVAATIVNSAVVMDAQVSNAKMANIMLVMTVMELVSFAVGAAAARLTPIDKERRPVYEMLVSVHNTVFMALPLLQQVYGAEAVFYCALSCLPLDILLYTYGVMRLKRGDKGGVSFRDILSAPLIASVLAFFIMLLRIELPHIVAQNLSILSGATMPMSMMVVGATLGGVSAAETLKEWRIYVMCFVKLIVAPLLVWLAVRPLSADSVLLGSAVLIAASPSAVSVSVMSVQYERDGVFASQGILLSTALSILTMPLVLYMLTNFG